ncbi:hypothetical protein N7U49_00180 [Streptomyces sp. AD2-2]|nr:hypothetical protein N7U49_00180 [Streptomyces sp. AD2-2]
MLRRRGRVLDDAAHCPLAGIALRGHAAYVLSAAYATAKDPNLILAHLHH